MNPGVQGRSPRPSFSPFLGRNGDPRRAGGAPGALRPKGGFGAAHPKGTHQSPAPPHAGAWLTRAATARAARTPEAPAWASPRVIPAPSPAAKKLGRAVSRSGESFSRAE